MRMVWTKNKRKKHVCKESNYCICSQFALEPNENCPIHGAGEYPPRCMYCGEFIKRKTCLPN